MKNCYEYKLRAGLESRRQSLQLNEKKDKGPKS